MNDLEKEMHRVIDAVLSACITTITNSGEQSLTKDDVLGASRKENAVLTRCMLAHALRTDGFSFTTIAQLLNKTEMAVRKMAKQHTNLVETSNAYKIAFQETKTKLKDK